MEFGKHKQSPSFKRFKRRSGQKRPPELWLPGTFHELPDSLVSKYMNDYRCGLRARMHFPKVMEELDFMSWCCGSFTPSYIRDYAPISI